MRPHSTSHGYLAGVTCVTMKKRAIAARRNLRKVILHSYATVILYADFLCAARLWRYLPSHEFPKYTYLEVGPLISMKYYNMLKVIKLNRNY